MNQLKDHKDKEADIYRNIIHHDIALIDEKYDLHDLGSTLPKWSAKTSIMNTVTP